jgi:GNAT superfamily N-acetyltransferase
MREDDLTQVDRIFRLAFGTFLGIPEPERFGEGRELARGRWLADPEAAFVAEDGGDIVGSNFATKWGSVAFFGPLTVRPDLWNQGVAQRLLDATMDLFERWGVTHSGLFTFAQSTKHVHLYQRYGFWPRFLTVTLAKQIEAAPTDPGSTAFSQLSRVEREAAIDACAELTGWIYPGLDLRREILAVADQGLGETILMFDGSRLESIAVCHYGPASEAGEGECYPKVAAVRPGPAAGAAFDRQISAIEALAARQGLTRVVAGVNTARHAAYTRLLQRGYRSELQGVTMHRPDETGYDRADIYLLDDWR